MTTEAMLRELERLVDMHRDGEYNRINGAVWFMHEYGTALVEAVRDASSRVVVTRDSTGEIVAVTRQDDDGRILKVIAEKFTEEQRRAHQLDHALTIIAIDQARAEGGK